MTLNIVYQSGVSSGGANLLGGVDYIVLVDRLTGYIRAEQTPNQGTDSAIQVIKNWSLLFGYPLKIISDGGGGFRDDFIQKLRDNCIVVKQVISSVLSTLVK